MFIPSAHDPLRSPAWRFQRASYLAAESKCLTRHDDSWTHTATHFTRRLARCRTAQDQQRLAQHEPYLHQAYQVYCSGSTRLRTELEARLLASEPVEQIARKCALPEQTVTCYESVFFSVAESLAQDHWIVLVAIQLHSGRGEQDLSKVVRLLGYAYGPLMLDLVLKVLSSPLSLPASFQQLAELERKELCTELWCRMCLAAYVLPFDPRTVVPLLSLQDQLQELRSAAAISPRAWQTFANQFHRVADAMPLAWEDDAPLPAVSAPVAPDGVASPPQVRDSGLLEGGDVRQPRDPGLDQQVIPERKRGKVPSRRRRQRKRTPMVA
jgi:hypothetical protein